MAVPMDQLVRHARMLRLQVPDGLQGRSSAVASRCQNSHLDALMSLTAWLGNKTFRFRMVCQFCIFCAEGSPSDNACPCVPVPLLDLKILPDLPQHWSRPVLLEIINLHIAIDTPYILWTTHGIIRPSVLSGASLTT